MTYMTSNVGRADTYNNALSMCRDLGYTPTGGFATIDFWQFKPVGEDTQCTIDFRELMVMHHGWCIAMQQRSTVNVIFFEHEDEFITLPVLWQLIN